MHIYHVASATPVVAIPRPARTPKATEVRTVVKRVIKRLKRRWPSGSLRRCWSQLSEIARWDAHEPGIPMGATAP
jgi:hypothetical protein